MIATPDDELAVARARGAKNLHRLLRHSGRGSIDVHALVHRNKSGEPYIQTAETPRSGHSSEHVYVSDGASMVFWQQRTYRLIWDEGWRTAR